MKSEPQIAEASEPAMLGLPDQITAALEYIRKHPQNGVDDSYWHQQRASIVAESPFMVDSVIGEAKRRGWANGAGKPSAKEQAKPTDVPKDIPAAKPAVVKRAEPRARQQPEPPPLWADELPPEREDAAASAVLIGARAARGGERGGRAPFPSVWFSEAQMPEASPEIIKGLLPRGALAIVYGESGTGKTFFTQDKVLHVACDLPWRGRRVTKSLVVYIAAEAGKGILKRFIAWRENKLGEAAAAATVPLLILTRGPNLLDGVEVGVLMQQLRDLSAEAGLPIGVVVFDTMSRSIPGGEENGSKDISSVIQVADEIRDELGAAVILVHHCGKDQARGMRGWSGLYAAADLVLEVVKGCATVEKVRDGVEGEKFPFRLQMVELGTDDDGDPITTCIVDHNAEAPAAAVKQPTLGAPGKVALQALGEVLEQQGETLAGTSTIPKNTRAVKLEQWRARFALRYGSDEGGQKRDGPAVRQAFKRGREALLKAGLVGISDPWCWLCSMART